MIVGYARTSTEEQKAGLEAQIDALTAAGAERIFSEQVSSVARVTGKKSVDPRLELAACLAYLREGDVLMVTKPDRLALSTVDLLNIEAELTKRKVGMVVQSIGGQPLDTRNPTSKLMLTLLAGIACWEREIMLERQRDGIAKAKAEGKFKGRKATIDPGRVKALLAQGQTPTQAARELKISRDSVYRLLREEAAQ
jgi:DNA invertase Pin-like site-specific DNA recombinase